MEACGESTGKLCEFILDVTDSPEAARIADALLARPAAVVFIIVGALVMYRIGSVLIGRFTRRYEHEIENRVARAAEFGTAGGTPISATRRLQRLHAIGGAARSGLAITLGVSAFLLSLSQLVDLGPVLAGAGLAGIVIGFGAQHLIADLLAGFSMLVEDQYGVGDWIDVDGVVGEVEHVGLRTTSFRDMDGVVWHVPNGNMSKVGNLTQRWARATLEIPLPLDVDIAHARRVIEAVAGGLAEDPEWLDDIIAPPEIWGITGWDADGIRMRLVIPTRPLRNFDVNRQMRERLKIAFDREGIRMPLPSREIAGTPLRAPVGVDVTQRIWPEEGRPSNAPSTFDATTTARIPPNLSNLQPRTPRDPTHTRPPRPD
jgi:small-conductance mechanosensitive channel